MPTSMEQYFRVLVPGTEPMGEEISVSHIHSLFLSKQIFTDTQVWDEDRKCWSSLMECSGTRELIQKLVKNLECEQQSLEYKALEDMVFEVDGREILSNTVQLEKHHSNGHEFDEIGDLDVQQQQDYMSDISFSHFSKNDKTHSIEPTPSTSLWDAWDESSIREIIEPATNQSPLEQEVVSSSIPIEHQEDNTNNLKQNDGDFFATPHQSLPESNQENKIHHQDSPERSDNNIYYDSSAILSEPSEIEIDLEHSFLEEITSDIPILPLEDLIDRQAELEAELTADMEFIANQKSVKTTPSESSGIPATLSPSQTQQQKPSNWQDFSKKSKTMQQEQQTVDFLTKQIFSAKNLDDLNSKGFDMVRRPPRQNSKFSMLRIFMLLFPGILIFWVFQLYIQTVSETKVERISKPTTIEEAEPLTYYDIMEIDVREHIPKDVKPVKQTQAESLQSALFIQLSQQSLHISDIDAVVTKWGGRKLDEPQRAEISITLISETDIDRDIAKIAMTIGLYMEHYALQIDKLDVIYKDTLHRYAIPIEPSHRLFLKDVNLEQFFHDMLSQ